MIIDKPHIGIFGRVNAGKSTLMNLLLGAEHSIVAPEPGTTTDPVRKNIEILGLGPVVLIDTAGLGDASALGAQRIKKTLNVLDEVDLALLVEPDESLLALAASKQKPFVTVTRAASKEEIIALIKQHLAPRAPQNMFSGLVKAGDTVVLYIPQDASAPQGRLILPQVQAIRTLVDLGVSAVCTAQKDFTKFNPALVVTDSQYFKEIAAATPQNIPLTSFSILLARMKGDFDLMLLGARAIENLKEGDTVLVMESCSHTVHNCGDIGRHKIPALLQKHTGKKLNFIFERLEELADIALAVQCGGCMATRTQILSRIYKVRDAGVPITNYGLLIAACTGILERATQPLKMI